MVGFRPRPSLPVLPSRTNRRSRCWARRHRPAAIRRSRQADDRVRNVVPSVCVRRSASPRFVQAVGRRRRARTVGGVSADFSAVLKPVIGKVMATGTGTSTRGDKAGIVGRTIGEEGASVARRETHRRPTAPFQPTTRQSASLSRSCCSPRSKRAHSSSTRALRLSVVRSSCAITDGGCWSGCDSESDPRHWYPPRLFKAACGIVDRIRATPCRA